MLTSYKAKQEQMYDKYYLIGYQSYFNNLPRDLADDLVLTDRASFLAGWDKAKQEFVNKSPRTPRPSFTM